jgi:hypothetical protein
LTPFLAIPSYKKEALDTAPKQGIWQGIFYGKIFGNISSVGLNYI